MVTKKSEYETHRILQIMPATVPYWAAFALDENKDDKIEILFAPVIGWQLLEDIRKGDFEGVRHVAAIITSRDGLIYDPMESKNFLGFSENKDPAAWQEEARANITKAKKSQPVEEAF